MAEGKCATCSRYLLVAFNFLFWLAGVVCVAVGIWVVAGEDSAEVLEEKVHIKIPEDALFNAAYVIIAVGSFILFVGFCGCCGAIRESAFMLGVYIIFMVILLCGEIAAAIYVAVEKGTIEQWLRDQLMAEVRNYTISANNTGIDFLQLRFSCCGSENFTDYRKSYYFLEYSNKMNWYVPDTCCRSRDLNNIDVINWNKCQDEARTKSLGGTELHTRGCIDILYEVIEENSAVLIGVASAIAFLEILGIIFAVCLIRNRTRYYYDYDDD